MMRRVLIGIVVVALAFVLFVWLRNNPSEDFLVQSAGSATPEIVERGRVLSLAGNCVGCHTVRGGAPYAGGRGIETPFGTVYASNITPDKKTGIGDWAATDFQRAMHYGRSKDGHLLYPAFPYQHFTLATREDVDAIYAYLQTLPAVERSNKRHDLRFPYNLQASLAVWRALYFSAGAYEPNPKHSAEWNRGAYLVRGLGHCGACHASRNLFGATENDIELAGGLIPMQNWYAPSLADPEEAGVQGWHADQIVGLLKKGVSTEGSMLGPMAEVVFRSTQYLPDEDVNAIAAYLSELPRVSVERPDEEDLPPVNKSDMLLGGKIYGDKCASCHGEKGEGYAGMYPALADSRAISLLSPNNVVKAILYGGFPPTTRGNPRPFGMPGFAHALKDHEIAAVATYIRQSWGNDAPPVSAVDVARNR